MDIMVFRVERKVRARGEEVEDVGGHVGSGGRDCSRREAAESFLGIETPVDEKD